MKISAQARARALAAVSLIPLLALAGCGGGSGDSADSGTNPPPPANNAPSISGQPASSVVEGSNYSFVPSASDPDGDTLTFMVDNAPAWASFNSANGALTGSPTSNDLGVHSGISISVSDGQMSDTLGPFDIEVLAVAQGSITLSWQPPTLSADGSQLNDLAGYRIRWGTQSGSYPNERSESNPGLSSFTVDNLPPGTYFFVVSAFDTASNESDPSNEATGTVQP